MRCAVCLCNSDNRNQERNNLNNIRFFTFPRDEAIKKLWVVACCRGDKFNVHTARICSKHFTDDDYERNLMHELLNYTPRGGRKLKSTAVPSLNLPKGKAVTDSQKGRQSRAIKRTSTKLVTDIIKASESQPEQQDTNITRDIAQNNSCVNEIVPEIRKSIGVNMEGNVEDSEKMINDLRKQVEDLQKRRQAVQKIFSQSQLKKLENPHIRPIWSVEDISEAISLYSAGPKAYRVMLKKGFPFPAVSTIRSWTKKIKIVPGILKQVINIIKNVELTSTDKICVMSFDEMKIKKVYSYDKVADKTLKPYSYAQVVMLRSLVGNWKQPIFFNYDCKMEKGLLFSIIHFVENAGFYICAVVSDLGGTNRGLHRDLKIDSEKPWFLSPTDSHKIYVLADVPHLLKLIRNNFLDYGFQIYGKQIRKDIIEELFQMTSDSDLRITYKISLTNLTVQDVQRQKVKWAAKLFSHTVSAAIKRCGTQGLFGKNDQWLECADFFKLVNDWFDCLNVGVPESDTRDRIKGFGLQLDTQHKILDEMSRTISEMRVIGKSYLMPFQKGVLLTNAAIKLYEDLHDRFGIKYILSYRLNQDVLENFFGVIRLKGELHDHPDPLQFKYRLRSYILGRNESSFTSGGNTEEDNTPDVPVDFLGNLLTGSCLSVLNADNQEVDSIVQDHIQEEIDDLKYDGLEHLTGYICHKMKLKNAGTSDSSTFTWTDQLSEGGLTKPPEELLAITEKLEQIFISVNGDSTIKICKNYLKNLLSMSQSVDCSEKMKSLFFRSRMYFRIKHLNNQLKDNMLDKRKRTKKFSKVCV